MGKNFSFEALKFEFVLQNFEIIILNDMLDQD
jgi:hypothetical protein